MGRFNVSAQSDQQDVIGEMETNRQQKTARGPGMSPGAGSEAANLTIRPGRQERVEGPDERSASCAARRSQGAFDALATLCPGMRTFTSALRALPARRCVARNG